MLKRLWLVGLLLISPVIYADWEEITSNDEYIVYFDNERIIKVSGYSNQIDVWVKFIIHSDLTKDGLSVGDYKLFKMRFQCAEQKYAMASFYYYKGSKIIDSYKAKYLEFDDIIPESVGDNVASVVCS